MAYLHLIELPDTPKSPLVHPFYPDVEIALIETETVPSFLFKGSKSLQRVIFSSHVKTVSRYAFFECTNLVSVQFSLGLKRIEDFAFDGCRSLDCDLIIPPSVIHIGVGAFRNACLNSGDGHLLYLNCDSLSFYPHDEDRKLGLHFFNNEKLTVLKRVVDTTPQERLGHLLEAFVLNIIDEHKDPNRELKS